MSEGLLLDGTDLSSAYRGAVSAAKILYQGVSMDAMWTAHSNAERPSRLGVAA